jgi:hypothetical protein
MISIYVEINAGCCRHQAAASNFHKKKLTWLKAHASANNETARDLAELEEKSFLSTSNAGQQ